ncbi:MAG TPA: HD domain-containing phosphohydrolase [Geobacteraceae bacterium]|nr:HD domain-containing phosphohydrolase [Geobacteraceae bacterium]
METGIKTEKLDREMIRIGRALVTHFFVLLKTAQNYKEGHAALAAPLANVLAAISEIHKRSEEASIRVKRGYLLVGEVRLKPDGAGLGAFNFMTGELKRYLIGGICFLPLVSAEEISNFVYIFNEIEPIPTPMTYIKFLERMQQRMVMNIELDTFGEDDDGYEDFDGAELTDNKIRSRKIYSHTVNAVSEVMENAKMGHTLRLRKSKRVVQCLIDQLLAAETNLIGLTTIRCHDEYTYNHSVNVCILSLAIGQRVGLSKQKLCELGMAALFHDIGKSEIPLAILNKSTEFSREEWEIMQQHPLLGVKKLMKLKGLDALGARIISGAFEHHLYCDFSGYPRLPYKRLSLFGRIISIADCYDGITSSRVYSRVAHPPDKALRFMLSRAGKIYDPVLLKLFVNCIGIYPIGTLLLLDSRELGIVVENNPDPEKWNYPRVKIIADAKGTEVNGEVIDLADPRCAKSVKETLDPNQYQIDVGNYFS